MYIEERRGYFLLGFVRATLSLLLSLDIAQPNTDTKFLILYYVFGLRFAF